MLYNPGSGAIVGARAKRGGRIDGAAGASWDQNRQDQGQRQPNQSKGRDGQENSTEAFLMFTYKRKRYSLRPTGD